VRTLPIITDELLIMDGLPNFR